MTIYGIDNLTEDQLKTELKRGGRFILYESCISIIFMSFKSPSIHFLRAGENAVRKGLAYSVFSVVFGWWGIPYGPIYTVGALITNFGGGKNVTRDIRALLKQNGVNL